MDSPLAERAGYPITLGGGDAAGRALTQPEALFSPSASASTSASAGGSVSTSAAMSSAAVGGSWAAAASESSLCAVEFALGDVGEPFHHPAAVQVGTDIIAHHWRVEELAQAVGVRLFILLGGGRFHDAFRFGLDFLVGYFRFPRLRRACGGPARSRGDVPRWAATLRGIPRRICP